MREWPHCHRSGTGVHCRRIAVDADQTNDSSITLSQLYQDPSKHRIGDKVCKRSERRCPTSKSIWSFGHGTAPPSLPYLPSSRCRPRFRGLETNHCYISYEPRQESSCGEFCMTLQARCAPRGPNTSQRGGINFGIEDRSIDAFDHHLSNHEIHAVAF